MKWGCCVDDEGNILSEEMWKWKNEFELLKQQARRNGCDYANLIQTGKLGLRDNDDHDDSHKRLRRLSLEIWMV